MNDTSPKKSDDRECCSKDKEIKSCGCGSASFCSPCVYIWGAFAVYLIVSYLIR